MEETGVTTPTGVVEEFDRTIHEELDFAHEARNAQVMADAARPAASSSSSPASTRRSPAPPS